MANRRKSRLTILALLLSMLLIATASAAIYFQITANMDFGAEWSPVAFTSGDDTSACSGDISNNASASFTSIPLAIGSNITITELVNLTNSDSTNGHAVKVNVSSEDFGTSLKILLLYLVSPSGTETLVVKIDDLGDVATEGTEVTIPASQVYAMKLIGCYDSGTSGSQTNNMKLSLQVTR